MAIDVEQLGAIIVELSHQLEAAAPELRALDAEIGDGDLGLTITLGMRAVRRAVAQMERVEPATLVLECGKAFADANPSTMGTLIGAALASASQRIRGSDELGLSDFTAMAHGAFDGIQSRGKAEVGQKTILDALAPSVEALDDVVSATGSDLEAVTQLRFAAEEGAHASDALQAEIGRASWLHERSRGKRDPGAQCWVHFARAVEDIVSRRATRPVVNTESEYSS